MTDILGRRDFLIGSGAGVLAGLLVTPANAVVRGGRALAATTIYRNARVWTGERAHPWTDAIALRGNRIVALGERASRSLATRGTHVIDLGGAMVVPGMMDNHTHFVSGSRMLTQVDLLSVKTRQQLVDTLAKGAAALPPGKWLEGFGWDEQRWGGELPTRSWIDAVTPKTPVSISRTDGHNLFLNGLALKLAGIDRNTADPDGGTIVRDAAGKPTGILRDNAMDLANRVIPASSDAEIDSAIQLGIQSALSRGTTQVHGADMDWITFDALRRARARGETGLRFYPSVWARDWAKLAEIIKREGRGDDWVRWGIVKAMADGALGSRTAYMDKPFANDAKNSGLLIQPIAEMQDWCAGADRAGLQIEVHAIGTKAIDLTLDMFAVIARKNGPRDRRSRIEHAQHINERSIGRFKKQGVIASMQPYHAIDDGRWAAGPLGPDRISGSWAFRSLLDSGATLTFGSDWPVAPVDPLGGIEAAVRRMTTDGKGVFGPAQRITVAEALHAYTAANAFGGFQEAKLGTLAPGKLADLVVLDSDIIRVAPDRIGATRVLRTIVDGKERYADSSA
jgi:predicted amidohydrolase YtcJ